MQAIFVEGSVLMGKWPKNDLQMMIFRYKPKTHQKVLNALNQRHHFWGKIGLIKTALKFAKTESRLICIESWKTDTMAADKEFFSFYSVGWEP